jgi:hypothetical protein
VHEVVFPDEPIREADAVAAARKISEDVLATAPVNVCTAMCTSLTETSWWQGIDKWTKES